jgi:16S rRNA processing protein RimM
MSDDLIPVGKIVRAHGTSGELVIAPDIHDAELFDSVEVCYLEQRHLLEPVRLDSARSVLKGDRLSFFVKFENVRTRNEAELLKGIRVFLPQADVPDTDDEQGVSLFIGYSVLSEAGELEGEVLDVLETPAHPLLQIIDSSGSCLVPFVEAFIIDADHELKTITVRNLDDFREL